MSNCVQFKEDYKTRGYETNYLWQFFDSSIQFVYIQFPLVYIFVNKKWIYI